MWKTLISLFSRRKVVHFSEDERLDSLWSKFKELKEEQEELKRLVKGIELEWEQVYDKMKHLSARIVKRAKVDLPPELPETPQNHELFPVNGSDPLGPIGMHARLQEARRRNGLLPR